MSSSRPRPRALQRVLYGTKTLKNAGAPIKASVLGRIVTTHLITRKKVLYFRIVAQTVSVSSALQILARCIFGINLGAFVFLEKSAPERNVKPTRA